MSRAREVIICLIALPLGLLRAVLIGRILLRVQRFMSHAPPRSSSPCQDDSDRTWWWCTPGSACRGALLQQREFLEQLACAASCDPAYDLTRSHVRRSSDQDVSMILADDPLQHFGLEDCTGVPDQCPYAYRDIACQDCVAVRGDPDKVVRDVVHRVTALSRVQSSSTVQGCEGLLYAAHHCGDAICPPQDGRVNLRCGKSP